MTWYQMNVLDAIRHPHSPGRHGHLQRLGHQRHAAHPLLAAGKIHRRERHVLHAHEPVVAHRLVAVRVPQPQAPTISLYALNFQAFAGKITLFFLHCKFIINPILEQNKK